MATLTVRLEDATLVALDRLAADANSPREGLIVRAIEEMLAQDARQIEKIEAGLAAAECGDFVSDDEVARVRSKFTRDL